MLMHPLVFDIFQCGPNLLSKQLTVSSKTLPISMPENNTKPEFHCLNVVLTTCFLHIQHIPFMSFRDYRQYPNLSCGTRQLFHNAWKSVFGCMNDCHLHELYLHKTPSWLGAALLPFCLTATEIKTEHNFPILCRHPVCWYDMKCRPKYKMLVLFSLFK